MSELNAAWGIAIFKNYPKIYRQREKSFNYYVKKLNEKNFYIFTKENISKNYGYMPLIFKNKFLKNKTIKKLNLLNIFPREYFYPSLNKLKHLSENKIDCKISESISERIICLPLYEGISNKEIDKIVKVVNSI